VPFIIWNDGKIKLDMVLKMAFLGTKGWIWADGVSPSWRELQVPHGGDYGVKNGGLKLEDTYFLEHFP
jgi:hypothetical protein